MSDDRLTRVRWIGGTSGAGKTTIARGLANKFGGTVYSTDDSMREHAQRLDRERAPLLHAFVGMTMDQRWLLRSPQEMLDTFHWYQGEGFELILEDLANLDAEGPIFVEGHRLLPNLVHPLLSSPRHAVWLIPTAGFRRAAFESRGSTWTIAGNTSDPPRALENLFERERLLGERLRSEAQHLGLHVIDVDESATIEGLVERCANHFDG